MTHIPKAVTELHKSIIRLRELGAFDRDTYMEAVKLLNGLKHSFAIKDVRQIEASMSKIARLVNDGLSKHHDDDER
jgi:hypothetical protein